MLIIRTVKIIRQRLKLGCCLALVCLAVFLCWTIFWPLLVISTATELNELRPLSHIALCGGLQGLEEKGYRLHVSDFMHGGAGEYYGTIQEVMSKGYVIWSFKTNQPAIREFLDYQTYLVFHRPKKIGEQFLIVRSPFGKLVIPDGQISWCLSLVAQKIPPFKRTVAQTVVPE
jgi:hypothetical protein